MIQQKITYPHVAKRFGWTGKVTVSFIVLENGRADNIKVLKSSGYNLLDRNVIETIKFVSPFPKPPVKAELRMPITYQLE
jgi:protein TonB